MEIIERLIYLRFISPQTLFILKIISVAISLIFLALIIILLKHTSWLRWRYTEDMRDFMKFKSFEKKKFEKTWSKIKKRLEKPLQSEYKLAIIEADDLLNGIFKKLNYQGDSLGERLDHVPPGIISNIGDVRNAHKIYNNIVHDPDYQIELEQVKDLMKIYEKSFRDLNMLG